MDFDTFYKTYRDRPIRVSFIANSYSFKLYGSYIVGCLFFPEKMIEKTNSIKIGSATYTDTEQINMCFRLSVGFITKYDISNYMIEELETKGFYISDVKKTDLLKD